MVESLFQASNEDLLRIFMSAIGIFLVVITYTRIAGLRSFSKMSSFDFAMTVAIGSVMATVAVAQVSLVEGMVAIAGLYVLQVVIALLRRFVLFKRIVDNTPTLLMSDGRMLADTMRKTRVTEDDILSKLRENNVHDLASVKAVVMETTGDISVLHGTDKLDKKLLDGVRGSEHLSPGHDKFI